MIMSDDEFIVPDTVDIHVHENVENESAYVGAAKATIYARANAKRLREWIAQGNQDLHDWLMATGEFEPTYEDYVDEEGPGRRAIMHPMTYGIFANRFVAAMHERLTKWGSLTDKQTAALRKAFEHKKQKVADREKRRQERRDSSKFIGKIDERREFTGIVKTIKTGEGTFGRWVLTIVETDEGKVVYWNDLWDKKLRSNPWANEGDKITFAARIKAHDEDRNGERQTVVSRATKIVNHTRREKERVKS